MIKNLLLSALLATLAITAFIAFAAPTISLAQNMTGSNMTSEGNMTAGNMSYTDQTGSISKKK